MKISLLLSILFIGCSEIVLGQEIVDSGYVKIKKVNLYYEIYGEGEPIVFLNGGPGFSSKGYRRYAELLSEHYKVILFDQRGTGRSAYKTKKISMLRMVKDLDQLRKHLKIESWNVFGHSFGGKYAYCYTSKFPKRVSSLILSATPGCTQNFGGFQKFPKVDISNYTEPELRVLLEMKEELETDSPDQDKVDSLKGLLISRFYTQYPENYKLVIDWFRTYRNTKGFVLYQDISSEYIKRKLQKFEKPVLIIHGLNDFINIQNPKENHGIFPNSQLKFIEQSGHMIILDQYELYKSTILDFLNSH